MNLQCPKCYSTNVYRKSFSSNGKQRFKCKDCGHRTIKPIGVDQLDSSIVPQKELSARLRSTLRSKKWVITSAQNATPVHKGFLASLESYCANNGADLIVIPYRYKNPTSVFVDKEHEYWDETITKYIINSRVDLCKGLTVLGDVQIQPTAKTPLTGLDGFTGTNSCIVGHPRYQFKTVATRQGDMAKIMTTTGSITVPNYTRSRAGKSGQHHHTFAATVVETDGELFFIRQVTANDDGTFTDFETTYRSDGTVVPSDDAISLVLGDLHQWWHSPDVDKATFGEGGLIDTLNPEHVLIHDGVDGYSISHHHRNDPFIGYAKHKFGLGSVRREIEDFADYMNKRMEQYYDCEFHIVSSNHDDHITRYIKESDWRQDPENAEFYLETAYQMIKNTHLIEGGSGTIRPFDYWMEKLAPDLHVISRSESMEIKGVEHAYHGDVGPNGSRGSAKNLSTIGVKATVGHGHSPMAEAGCYMVGTSTGKMAYANAGPSGWLNTHCVMYADGKRAFIHIIKGKFRA